MAKPRPYRKYVFKVGNKKEHGGITTDLERREREHQQKWPTGHISKSGDQSQKKQLENGKEKKVTVSFPLP